MADDLVRAMLGFGAVIRPYMQAEIRKVAAASGLTERDVTILEFITRKERTSFGEIASHLQVEHERGTSTSRVSATIATLFGKRRVIKKEVNPKNQRKQIITVTAKGQRVLERISQARRRVYEQIGLALKLDRTEARKLQKALEQGTENFRRFLAQE